MRKLLKAVGLLVMFVVVCLAALIGYFQVPDQSVAQLSERWATPPSEFISINGMQVHVRDEGPRDDPKPIILLHGTSASLHTWQGWAERLSLSRRVIRFDLPAFGLTGPHPQGDYRIETYAKTVVAVMQHFNIEQAVIGGNSLGGYVAWATAVLYPQRVDSLILVNASGYPYESQSVPLGFKIASQPLLNRLLGDALPRSVIRGSLENVYSDTSKVTEALVQQYFELTTRAGNRDALVKRFEQTVAGPLSLKVPDISQPTLIIWGRDDKLIPLKMGRRFAQEIPNSRLVILDNLGHIPHEEGPKISLDVAIEFINAPEQMVLAE